MLSFSCKKNYNLSLSISFLSVLFGAASVSPVSATPRIKEVTPIISNTSFDGGYDMCYGPTQSCDSFRLLNLDDKFYYIEFQYPRNSIGFMAHMEAFREEGQADLHAAPIVSIDGNDPIESPNALCVINWTARGGAGTSVNCKIDDDIYSYYE